MEEIYTTTHWVCRITRKQIHFSSGVYIIYYILSFEEVEEVFLLKKKNTDVKVTELH